MQRNIKKCSKCLIFFEEINNNYCLHIALFKFYEMCVYCFLFVLTLETLVWTWKQEVPLIFLRPFGDVIKCPSYLYCNCWEVSSSCIYDYFLCNLYFLSNCFWEFHSVFVWNLGVDMFYLFCSGLCDSSIWWLITFILEAFHPSLLWILTLPIFLKINRLYFLE